MAKTPTKTRTGKKPAKTKPKGAGRPRSEACHQAVLDAAAHLLETETYCKISMEKIAELAKVGKPTLYRWWPSKADIILEAYRAEGLRRVPATELSNDAFADLEDFLKRLLRAHRNRTTARGLRALIAESQFDPEFRDKFFKVFLSMRRGLMRDILQSGIDKGQFRASIDVEAVMDVLFGGFWYRLLSGTPGPMDDAYAETMLEMIQPALMAHPESDDSNRLPDRKVGVMV